MVRACLFCLVFRNLHEAICNGLIKNSQDIICSDLVLKPLVNIIENAQLGTHISNKLV